MHDLATRRAFVGAAVGGAALLGPIAWLAGRSEAPTADGIRVVDAIGAPTGFRPDPEERGRWERRIGQTVQLTGNGDAVAATVAMVTAQPVIGARPAGLRPTPFTVHFAFERGTAPAGDHIYDVAHAVDGLTRLFLQSAQDRAGKAMMVALLN